ncbi:MAG: MBL fold metallo-hydrolase [Chloroflexota bacterium]
MTGNPYFKIEQVTEGVYAALAVDMERALGNTAIVDLGNETLILDTFASPQAAEVLREVAIELTGKAPRWVVNSHHHGDHVLGNQCFVESATFIATAKTHGKIEELTERAVAYRQSLAEELDKLRQDATEESEERAAKIAKLEDGIADLDNLQITLPTLLFENKLSLHGTARSVEILTFGGGHTLSDSLIYLPNDGIVLLADLLFQGEKHPWVGDGNPAEWIEILEQVLQLSAETFVPGHGEVTERHDVERQLAYMRDFVTVVEQKKRNPDWEIDVPEAYRGWEGEEWFKRGVNELASA